MTEEKKKRRSFEEQLRITDRTSCEQAIRNGGVAALILVLAVFIFRKSRVASTVMLVYYVVSKILQAMDGSVGIGLVVAVFFVLWFVAALRGTYLWHSKYRHEAAAPEAAS